MAVIPIGGADMPVVICLLNSYSGLAPPAPPASHGQQRAHRRRLAGRRLGLILTSIMCKAMNRSLANVLFGGLRRTGRRRPADGRGRGQADHRRGRLLRARGGPRSSSCPATAWPWPRPSTWCASWELLEANGAEVKLRHPPGGRPHARPHERAAGRGGRALRPACCRDGRHQPMMETVDVAIVIGANDVVNPAARTEVGSPIYGMPIIDVDKAAPCSCSSARCASGFAGRRQPAVLQGQHAHAVRRCQGVHLGTGARTRRLNQWGHDRGGQVFD